MNAKLLFFWPLIERKCGFLNSSRYFIMTDDQKIIQILSPCRVPLLPCFLQAQASQFNLVLVMNSNRLCDSMRSNIFMTCTVHRELTAQMALKQMQGKDHLASMLIYYELLHCNPMWEEQNGKLMLKLEKILFSYCIFRNYCYLSRAAVKYSRYEELCRRNVLICRAGWFPPPVMEIY